MLLVEMKSRGQDLEKAYQQALEYCHGLNNYELPKLILICDFQHFHVYREDGLNVRFELHELVENLQIFEELAGYQKRTYYEEDPVNIAAAELMGKLHDKLKAVGYKDHELEVYLVRLLFILFADDSTIWQPGLFLEYLEVRTNEDGSDLAMHLDQLFQVLDTPATERFTTLDEQLNMFPYVNGRLFSKRLRTASFNSEMRQILLECCKLDWGKISPAIFGSLFQSVMDDTHRRNLGAHYTSEKNIMKVIKPLFVDKLWDEYRSAGEDDYKLRELHRKISKMRFLDPACGCGNFLIIAFRELRLLELAIVEKRLKGQGVTNINQYFLVDLDQFYGIEYGEFASQIAQVAMWLIDHQMNMLVSDKFGEYIPLIPLIKSAVIIHGNALQIDWQEIVLPNAENTEVPTFDFILGNPPFVGKKEQNVEQKKDLETLAVGIEGAGVLDYVTGWYLKAGDYLKKYSHPESSKPTVVSFVSTNSICQGEQPGILWSQLVNNYKITIHFAHQTFKWSNEAKGVAAVHCVIVGFSNFNIPKKKLYTYSTVKGEPDEIIVYHINGYLTAANDVFVANRKNPLCEAPKMNYGSMPIDDGHLTVEDAVKKQLEAEDPLALKFIRPYVGGDEFINNKPRWCIWIEEEQLPETRLSKFIQERISATKMFRQLSKRAATNKLAAYPAFFGERRQPNTNYIIIPKVSSEAREYIPIGILDPQIIVSGSALVIPDASKYHFGILTSTMHNTWMRYVCGRMKSDYQYSASIVYNNFPWAETPTEKQKQAVEDAAQAVLNARAMFPNNTLADLYDPNTMPPVLIKAHQQLDKCVDECYRPKGFSSEMERIEFLFSLYGKYTGGLFVDEITPKKTSKVKASRVSS
jgi:hypothetical protein